MQTLVLKDLNEIVHLTPEPFMVMVKNKPMAEERYDYRYAHSQLIQLLQT